MSSIRYTSFVDYNDRESFEGIGIDGNPLDFSNTTGVSFSSGFYFETTTGFERYISTQDRAFLIGNYNQALKADFSDQTVNITINTGDLGDVLLGGSGNDILNGGAGADTLTGGTGNDTAIYSTSALGVTVNLTTLVNSGGDAQDDILTGIENVTGSAHADTIIGNAFANILRGGGGADTLDGGLGNDRLVIIETPADIDGGGGTGRDFLFVKGGGTIALTDTNFANIDTVYVQINTTLDMSGVSTGQRIISQSATSTNTTQYFANITGTSGNDTIIAGRGEDTIHGGGGGDVIRGGSGFATLYGDAGNDTLLAGPGGAFLSGGDGNDILRGSSIARSGLAGGADNDRIVAGDGGAGINGGAGHDALFAGTGSDTFVFISNYGRDEILRFDIDNDYLDVRYFAENISDVIFASVHGGRDTLITFNGDTDASHKIIVHDVAAGTLQEQGHFIF